MQVILDYVLIAIVIYWIIRWIIRAIYDKFIDVPPRAYTMEELKEINRMSIGQSPKNQKLIWVHYDEIKKYMKELEQSEEQSEA